MSAVFVYLATPAALVGEREAAVEARAAAAAAAAAVVWVDEGMAEVMFAGLLAAAIFSESQTAVD